MRIEQASVGELRRRLARIVGLSAAGLVVGSAILALVYFLMVVPLGPAPRLPDVFQWQLATWAVWLVLAPACVAFGETVSLRFNKRPKRRWWLHSVATLAVLGIHALWTIYFSILLSPYVTPQDAGGAAAYFLRFPAPIDVAIYAALVSGVAHSVAATLALATTPEGLLRAPRWTDAGGGSRSEAMVGGPVLVYDADTLAVLAVDEAAIAKYGWSINEFLGLSLVDIVVQDGDDSIAKTFLRVRDLPLWRARCFHRVRDGSPIEVETVGIAVNLDGAWARMLLVTDITEAACAQRALEESERKFREIFEDAVVGIFRSTPAGRLTMLNSAGARILGYAAPGNAIRTVKDLASAHYLEAADRARFVAEIRAHGSVIDRRTRMKRKDGTVIWVTETAKGVFNGAGDLEYVEGTFADVTQTVTAQEALRESEYRAIALRMQLSDAQLRALKLQLKPHFLFNILNTVSMMIRGRNYEAAQRVVTTLGDMFRRFLEIEGVNTLTLNEEVAFVGLYLELERFRFEDRMVISQRIDPAALSVQVPTMLLQPVVENAVKHGVSQTAGRCSIELSASCIAGHLTIEVVNDMSDREGKAATSGAGIGISNTRARLREMYGDRAAFTLSFEKGRARAALRLPIQEGVS